MKTNKFTGSESNPSRSAGSDCAGEARATPDGCEMPATGHPQRSIKAGDCFFNLRKFSCLRIKRVYEAHISGIGYPPEGCKAWYADAVTWRPDGSKGSNIVKVRLDSLTKLPYSRIQATRVYCTAGSFEFDVSPLKEKTQ